MIISALLMKKALYFVRTYKFDLLTALFAAISYYVAFRFAQDSTTLLWSSLFITLVSVVLIIFIRLRDRDFYFVGLSTREDKDEWIGKGIFEYKRTHNAYLITESEPGYVYSKCFTWNDYKYEFEFKIINLCLGAIVRAVNLSNYLMFQIREDGIRPHIRVNGGWRPWEHQEVGLTFHENLSLDKWYKCSLSCEKDLINIKLQDKKEAIFQRSWSIPSGRIAFPFPQRDEDPNPPTIHFPVDLDYGTIGVRNANEEKALVKNVLVERI